MERFPKAVSTKRSFDEIYVFWDQTVAFKHPGQNPIAMHRRRHGEAVVYSEIDRHVIDLKAADIVDVVVLM